MKAGTALGLVSSMFTLVSSGVASAEEVTFVCHGTLTAVDAPLMGFFTPGDELAVTYTFESTTPDEMPDPNYGRYTAITSMSVTLGQYAGWSTGGYIQLSPINSPSDNASYYDVIILGNAGLQGPPVSGFDIWSVEVHLASDPYVIVQDDSLPTSPPPVPMPGFGVAQFRLLWIEIGGTQLPQVVGTVTSFEQPVAITDASWAGLKALYR